MHMNKITIEQLHELYVDTAKRCSSEITALSDEEIEYNLFEEFDVGVRSFFHDDNLHKLLDGGMITKEIVLLSRDIRSRWIELNETNWTISVIKSNPSWNQLFSSCDKLIALLEQRN